jgi:glycosyltransferase involved in cell wall biosynthesis
MASAMPDVSFGVVGASYRTDDYADFLIARMSALPNVDYYGYVPNDQLDIHYESAAVFVCTSQWEGFPNTFLEAWSHGRPTVTTCDPDGVVHARRLGYVASNVEGLIAAVRRLLTDEKEWHHIAANAQCYFRSHHSVDKAADEYEDLFRELTCPPLRLHA